MASLGFMRTTIKELFANSFVDQEIVVCGWIRTRRDSKAGFSFINLSDGSCFTALQVIVNNNLCNYEEILHLTTGCSIKVEGKLVASPGEKQTIELQASKVEILGNVGNPETYPMAAKRHTLEHLRDYLHLRVRTNTIGAVMRVRHTISMAIHRFFNQNGFYWVHTPIITSSDCEGAGEMFRVSTLNLSSKGEKDYKEDFFGKECFLTVSGQLNVESYCEALGRVYTFGPTFRAENSNTSRHLAEFWMVEPEIAFADLNDNAELASSMLKAIAKTVLNECSEDMAFFAEKVDQNVIQRLEKMVESEFVHLDYTEAIKLLQASKHQFEFPVNWGIDLQSEHERFLTEQIIKSPVILKNYPKEIKSFYMRLNPDEKTVAAMDILVPGIGEIIGGSQREERLVVLEQRMKDLKMDLSLYQWYLDLRRYGTVYHAGFGLGLERMIMYVTGMSNIRDVIPFPRFPKHAEF